jgi:hypothetical protein
MQQFWIYTLLFPVSRQDISEAIAAVDLKYQAIICRSSTIAGNNPTADMCWIRLSPLQPVSPLERLLRTCWKLAEFSRQESLQNCNLVCMYSFFFYQN